MIISSKIWRQEYNDNHARYIHRAQLSSSKWINAGPRISTRVFLWVVSVCISRLKWVILYRSGVRVCRRQKKYADNAGQYESLLIYQTAGATVNRYKGYPVSRY